MKSSGSTAVTDVASPARMPAWSELAACAARLAALRTDALYRADPARFAGFGVRAVGVHADFSKQRIDESTRRALLKLAEQAGVVGATQALFAGQKLNFTEQRAALHMALRGSCSVPSADARALNETNTRMRRFAQALREGAVKGSRGDPIRRVINLGIGGSDLGPRMACEALLDRSRPSPVRVDFAANIDPRELDEALVDADPRTTLFIVSSKSFSTLETLANARAAEHWLKTGLGDDVCLDAHFAAVSNQPEQAARFGIDAERVFAVPEWVGGRFSVWSAVGLPLLIAIGEAAFDSMLAGARAIDEHFRDAAPEANIPLMMALTGLWNSDFLAHDSLAVLPYAHGLRSFPAWLQQLDMESNGKHCRRDGLPVETGTAPIVFGHAGTVGQHAFHQLLYQGTRRVAADFIVPLLDDDERSRAVYENALAQSAALMEGRDLDAARRMLHEAGEAAADVERLAPHLVCPGNVPSTTLLLPDLGPASLGRLMALYEHKVFVQGWIWGINSFDQYGVELGKDMARRIADPARGPAHPSTAALLDTIRDMRATR